MGLGPTHGEENPSPLWGRGWTAAGVFTSRGGPGEGVPPKRALTFDGVARNLALMAKVMVLLPTQFLSKVDRAARSQGRSRSGLIREALRVPFGEREARQSWKEALAPLRELEAQ